MSIRTKRLLVLLSGAALLLAGSTPFAIKKYRAHRLWMWRVQDPNPGLVRKTPPQVTLVRTKFNSARWLWTDKGAIGIAQPLKIVIPVAYNFAPTMTVFDTPLPMGRYDFIANLPQGSMEGLQAEITKQFGLTARRDKRLLPAWELKVKDSGMADGHLKPTAGQPKNNLNIKDGECTFTGVSMGYLAHILGLYLQMPVVDRTELRGSYDFQLKFDWNPDHFEPMKRDLTARLGLELIRTRETLEVLVVEKAR